jgi:DNA-binding transcriptional MerR regulator
MTEESSTRITMKELYLQVQKIQSMLEKLTAQLPSISDQLDELEKDVNVRLTDHETRIRKMEMTMWKLFGAIGLAAAVLPTVISLVQ